MKSDHIFDSANSLVLEPKIMVVISAIISTSFTITPNSGITLVPIIYIFSSPSFTGMLIVRNSLLFSFSVYSVCIGSLLPTA